MNSPCTFAHTHKDTKYVCTHTHIHTKAGQSAWHQTAVHNQMRCVRAPCCQEADRKKKKQTLFNGDITCSLGRKLKQMINGPWSLQYSSRIPSAAPPLCTPSLSSCPMLAEGVRHFKSQASHRDDLFLPPHHPNSTQRSELN